MKHNRAAVLPRRDTRQSSPSHQDHLQRVIEAECAAWLALLAAVPDYADSRAAVDLSAPQLQLVAAYVLAHAERIQALG